MRLAVSAIGVIVLVILGTDPLSASSTLSTSWPDPSGFYQLIPLGLIDFVAAFTVATARDQRACRAREVQPRPLPTKK